MNEMICKNFFDYQEPSLSGVLVKMTTLHTRYSIHTHNYYELEYQISGRGCHSLNGNVYQSGEGHFYLLRPGDSHHMQAMDGPLCIIGICFAPGLMDPAVSSYLRTLTPPFIGTLPVQDRGLFYTLVAQMEKEALGRSRESSTLMTGCALTVLSLFSRHAEEFPQSGNTSLSCALDFIDQHYHESVTLEQTAAAVNLSPFYFSRYFRRTSGMTFSDYLARLRLSHVCAQMLKDPSCNLLTTAMDAGFGSYTSFYRVFEKFVGISPSEWRDSRSFTQSPEVQNLKDIVLQIGLYLRENGLLL